MASAPEREHDEAGRRLAAGTRRVLDDLHRSSLDAFCSVRETVPALTDRAAADALAGSPLGGLPIAVKEIFDVAGERCARGCAAFAVRVPDASAALVTRLEKLGAQIVGITRSTELAIARATPTSNPHDRTRTPGASSSGSAAAVGGGLVPFALGSQTIGSTIRPAAYCGVVGFKPSHGVVSLDGVMPLAPTLDHAGFLADTVDRLVGVTGALDGRLDAEADPAPLRFLFAHPWFADAPHAVVMQGLARVREALATSGQAGVDWDVPPGVAATETGTSDTILVHEMATLWFDALHGHEGSSERLRELLERGRDVPIGHYEAALEERERIVRALHASIGERDIVVAPAVTGPPPPKAEGTGSRDPQRLWTLAGLPAISLPIGRHAGLPLAVQLVARRGADRTLLSAARLVERLAG